MGRGLRPPKAQDRTRWARALTPGVLEMERPFTHRRGELVLLIDSSSGSLRLIPAETHDIEGRA